MDTWYFLQENKNDAAVNMMSIFFKE